MSHPVSARADFAALGVPAPLVSALSAQGIDTPFPIQTATLPDTLAGRDVLGRGRTGSGKTLAFALPTVARLAGLVDVRPRAAKPGRPRAMVLAPTRELAGQILRTIEPLAQATGLSSGMIVGGVNQNRQVQQLRRGVDIIVATPGRLEDLISQGHASLAEVEITILDEADHMADLGFLPVVTRLLGATPAGGQRLLFSATLDNGIDQLARRFLRRPLQHSVDSEQSPVAAMAHHVFLIGDATQKREVVQTLAGGTSRRLLFTRTKHQARKLARDLTSAGIPAVELHGNLAQNARERNLKAFAEGQVRVMVATDIAARGIHVDDVDLVVHVDPPAEHKAYLHRSGRTARAGNEGDVITLVLPEQRRDFQAIAKAAKISVAPTQVRPGDDRILRLVGDQAAPVAPQDAPQAAARKGVAQPARPSTRSGSSRQGRSQDAGRPQAGRPQQSGRSQQSGRPAKQRTASAGAPRSGTASVGSAAKFSAQAGRRSRPATRRSA